MESSDRYSNKDYKRLGDRIRSNPQHVAEADLQMLQGLRLSYKEPLAIIFKSLEHTAYKVDHNCICTYRVKRIESIISKLIRFPEMQVNRAEDIAGCRSIHINAVLKDGDNRRIEIQLRALHDSVTDGKHYLCSCN